MSKIIGKKAKLAALISILMFANAFSSCGGRSGNTVPSPSAVATRVVTDDLGRAITVPVKVARVVSTAPSVTENIFAVGAGDRLVGVTTFCNYPEEAKSIAKIGDTMNPNMETIVAMKPDIVFVSSASQLEAFTKTLESNGIAVYVTNPESLDGVINGLVHFGDLFGTQEKANALVADLKRRIAALLPYDGAAKYLKVFVQISKEPLFTIGKRSHLTNVLPLAGGESVTANVETAYPKLSKETASTLVPEVIILSESDDNKEPNEAFKNSPAVEYGRIYKINADLISRPGPRLVDALEQIAKCLHPEKL